MTLASKALELEVPAATGAHPAGRRYWLAVALLLILHFGLIWTTRTPAISPSANDDAQYLLLARSLQSLHYQDQHVVGTPVHSQYPPGYPAMLAVWTVAAGRSLNGALLLNALLAMVGLLLLTDLARRLVGPLPSLALLAALAVNPHLIDLAGRTVSEQPYLTLSLGALWALLVDPDARRRPVWAGVLAILAALTRSIGLSLVVAVALTWLLQRRYRRFVWFSLSAALLVGGWLAWTFLAPDQIAARSYPAAVLSQTAGAPDRSLLALLLYRAKLMITVYLAHSIPASLHVPTVSGMVADNAVAVGLILILLVAGFWGLRRRPVLLFYLAGYAAILWVWRFKSTRFMVPVAPVLLLVIVTGAVLLGRLWNRRAGLGAALLVCLPLMAKGVADVTPDVRTALHCRTADPTVSSLCFAQNRLSFFAAARYVRDHTPPGAAVLTIKEATFYYYSGRQVYHPGLAVRQDSLHLTRFLAGKGIDYVLVSGFPGGYMIARYLAPSCREVRLVRRWPGRTLLYQLAPADSSAGEPACPSLDSLAALTRQKE